MNTKLLSLENIAAGQGAVRILHNISFAVSHEDSLLICGPSGSGKTTLLSVMAGFIKPVEGNITSQLTLHDIGFVFQTLHLLPYLRVEEQLRLACYTAHKKYDGAYAEALLHKLQISHKARSHSGNLSTGEAQRVAIARALIHRPALVLADEPTAALDDANCESVITLLRQATSDTKAALVVVTHDSRVKSHFSRIITLVEGQATA